MRRALALAGLLAGAAAPAQALDTACLWARVPDGKKEFLAEAYETKGAQYALQVAPVFVLRDAVACIAAPRGVDYGAYAGRRMATVQPALALEFASEQFLAKHGFGRAELDQGWTSLSPEQRAAVQAFMPALQAGGGADEEAVRVAVITAAQNAGWRADAGEPTFQRFIEYYTARGAREYYDANL